MPLAKPVLLSVATAVPSMEAGNLSQPGGTQTHSRAGAENQVVIEEGLLLELPKPEEHQMDCLQRPREEADRNTVHNLS